ncbi:bifunctional phosphopantothenoylcysteine decarboxylase/phosphopantothenate--cysteine ligase CoaBC [Haloarchaeobius sp. TZWWS8]|uniref:bifunctional phosphopantothenoylcysteine decarboxylase/phosphopantothenate--cysteine ligase CoaBC n=1 Tax=Haloarchaeobius sp. TZWWS8 TaxID=3446121 RepID=UPI003EB82574
MLEGVNVALGVTGSIAAVKTVELAHELRRRGATVRAVMTGSAQGIVHPWAVEFATENDVVTEITGKVEHVALCGRDEWADVLLVAPATANTVGKIANAVDDTPVTTCATTAIGAGVPVVVAPAMHEPMYDHPGVLESIEKLESWDVDFVEPRIEEEKAKIAGEDAICLAVTRATSEQPLAGKSVVVTSGATSESVDPVRVLTNRSSGKMGRAVARAAYVLGADVTLVHANVGPRPVSRDAEIPDVTYADLVEVESAGEMLDATMAACDDADALVSVAAISDYTVEQSDEKIRSGQEELTLSLSPTPKLIDRVREAQPDLRIVGFKTETSGEDEKMVEAARKTLDRAGLAFVVANDASVMGSDETRALLVHQQAFTEYRGTKEALGMEVAGALAATLQ